MKHTILAMTFLAASVFARQAGIYDKSPEISASLQSALESAHYDVVRLTPPQLCDEHQLKALDLVVIPDAQVIPASALPMIRSFLQARKTLLLLGPRPFNILQYNDGEDWLTENEIRERRANIMSSPVSLQPTAVWKRSSRDSNIKGSLEVHGNSIHYMVDRLYGWNTYAAPCEGIYPQGHDLLCFRAKGNANTTALYIEFIEKDMMVQRKTATKYLDMIVKEGLLQKIKIGRFNYYMNTKLIELFMNQQEPEKAQKYVIESVHTPVF